MCFFYFWGERQQNVYESVCVCVCVTKQKSILINVFSIFGVKDHRMHTCVFGCVCVCDKTKVFFH